MRLGLDLHRRRLVPVCARLAPENTRLPFLGSHLCRPVFGNAHIAPPRPLPTPMECCSRGLHVQLGRSAMASTRHEDVVWMMMMMMIMIMMIMMMLMCATRDLELYRFRGRWGCGSYSRALQTHACTFDVCMYIYACMYICMYACMYVCVYVSMYAWMTEPLRRSCSWTTHFSSLAAMASSADPLFDRS